MPHGPQSPRSVGKCRACSFNRWLAANWAHECVVHARLSRIAAPHSSTAPAASCRRHPCLQSPQDPALCRLQPAARCSPGRRCGASAAAADRDRGGQALCGGACWPGAQPLWPPSIRTFACRVVPRPGLPVSAVAVENAPAHGLLGPPPPLSRLRSHPPLPLSSPLPPQDDALARYAAQAAARQLPDIDQRDCQECTPIHVALLHGGHPAARWQGCSPPRVAMLAFGAAFGVFGSGGKAGEERWSELEGAAAARHLPVAPGGGHRLHGSAPARPCSSLSPPMQGSWVPCRRCWSWAPRCGFRWRARRRCTWPCALPRTATSRASRWTPSKRCCRQGQTRTKGAELQAALRRPAGRVSGTALQPWPALGPLVGTVHHTLPCALLPLRQG